MARGQLEESSEFWILDVSCVGQQYETRRDETRRGDGCMLLVAGSGSDSTFVSGVQSVEKQSKRRRTWLGGLAQAFAFSWPPTFFLRIRLLCCLLILVAGRLANFLIPFLYKKVIDNFTELHYDAEKDKKVPSYYHSIWPYVVFWLGLILLQVSRVV